VIPLVIENHPYRPLADFERKLVRRLARHGSTFSGVGASDKPGAVQQTEEERLRRNCCCSARTPTPAA
jgi:hypothetical protein